MDKHEVRLVACAHYSYTDHVCAKGIMFSRERRGEPVVEEERREDERHECCVLRSFPYQHISPFSIALFVVTDVTMQIIGDFVK